MDTLCPTLEDLHTYGHQLATELKSGDVISLDGELGAGKTTLVQAIMQGLDYHHPVSSPTFALVQEYRGGRLDAWHFDFYRIKDEFELLDLGWDDYLDQDGIVLVEWASLFPNLLPTHTIALKLSISEDGARLISRS